VSEAPSIPGNIGLDAAEAQRRRERCSSLADAAGISTVRVNRVLQELRENGLIVLRGNRLEDPDWEQLKQVGDFDPTYLHDGSVQYAA
jgi:hypothetical protein